MPDPANFDPLLTAALHQRHPAFGAFPGTGAGWRSLATAAARTGLSGLVLERATALDISIPESAAEHLRRASFAVAAENVHLLRELQTVVAALNAADIPVMLLKGAALNLAHYRSPGLRPMSDLDLLVRHADVDRARAILEAAGCRRGAPLLREDFFPRFYYETEYFTGSTRPARIDLHARPFRPMRYACTVHEGAFWRGAETILCGSAAAWTPRPSVMFVHLAAHAAFHGCARLVWLYDLHRFVAFHGAGLPWSEVVHISRKWSLTLAVRTAIERATMLLGDFVPDDLRSDLGARRAGWCDRLVLARAPRDAESPAMQVMSTLLTTPSLRMRWGYLGAHLWPGELHLQSKQRGRPGLGRQMARWWGMAPRFARSATALVRRIGNSPAHRKTRTTWVTGDNL